MEITAVTLVEEQRSQWKVALEGKKITTQSKPFFIKFDSYKPSLCIMSQSIPEQLNADRREFADAVNALTKFVFLKYQLKRGR
ncbi:hypothetical protein Tco_1284599 [Tanacetum coccineum]